MPVIFSTHPLHPHAAAMLDGPWRPRRRLGARRRDAGREARDADIVIVRADLPPALFERAKRLRAAIRHGAGLDMIPMEAATKAGVLVANVPGANARTVAEHVFFVAMALLRRFRQVDRDLRARGWLAGRDHAASGNDLAGRTIGIVGFGAVGREVATIARHGFRPRRDRQQPRRRGICPTASASLGSTNWSAASDIVVLCCPLTPETTGLISRERIARMKPGALLINVSRGPVVDDAALIEALRPGAIGGAALDVFVDPAAAAGPSLFRLRQCDRHAAHGRHHRGKHDAHGHRRRRGGDPRARRRTAGQSAQSGSGRALSQAVSGWGRQI